MTWSEDARAAVAADGEAVLLLFPAAARHARAEGRDGEEVRAELLAAVRGGGEHVARIVTTVYQRGDAAEKHAVLTALPGLDRSTSLRDAVGDGLVPVVRDALRTNDTRLVAAALGPYAADHLDDPSWRQGVVKAIFMGIPLDGVADLDERTDDELRRMVRDLADERRAAGREVPADAVRLLTTPAEPTGSTR
ncbi:EboA domain-containing protein [Oryzobacter sp. R7]|uniref:EboA domain-containing protein n=1 Tax=Oryzobacter faecalis TaxID=3388656 RepID=UPI00398D3560